MKRPKKYDLLTLLNSIYPIGRGFIDFTNTDYSNYLGFTWERELVNLTPIGCNETGSNIGTEKGAEKHKHISPMLTTKKDGKQTMGISIDLSTYERTYGQTTVFGSYLDGENNIPSDANYRYDRYLTDEESSYQPSKVVAYWKRVA